MGQQHPCEEVSCPLQEHVGAPVPTLVIPPVLFLIWAAGIGRRIVLNDRRSVLEHDDDTLDPVAAPKCPEMPGFDNSSGRGKGRRHEGPESASVAGPGDRFEGRVRRSDRGARHFPDSASYPVERWAQPRRVLLIHSFGRDFEPFNTFSAEFRAGLARQSPQPVDFFDVALADARFDSREEGAFVDFLSALFAEHRLDLVVPMGAPAVGFAQKYRARLFPDTPMIMASVDQRMVQSSKLTTNDAVIAVRHDLAGLVQAMLRLMPETTNVVVVFGNSPLERFWSNEFMRESGLPTDHVRCESFSGLSFEQMKQRAAALPPGSVMLFGDLLVEGDSNDRKRGPG